MFCDLGRKKILARTENCLQHLNLAFWCHKNQCNTFSLNSCQHLWFSHPRRYKGGGGGSVGVTLLRVSKLSVVGLTEKAGVHALDENPRLVVRFFRQRSIFDQDMRRKMPIFREISIFQVFISKKIIVAKWYVHQRIPHSILNRMAGCFCIMTNQL